MRGGGVCRWGKTALGTAWQSQWTAACTSTSKRTGGTFMGALWTCWARPAPPKSPCASFGKLPPLARPSLPLPPKMMRLPVQPLLPVDAGPLHKLRTYSPGRTAVKCRALLTAGKLRFLVQYSKYNLRNTVFEVQSRCYLQGNVSGCSSGGWKC